MYDHGADSVEALQKCCLASDWRITWIRHSCNAIMYCDPHVTLSPRHLTATADTPRNNPNAQDRVAELEVPNQDNPSSLPPLVAKAAIHPGFFATQVTHTNAALTLVKKQPLQLCQWASPSTSFQPFSLCQVAACC